MRRRIDGPTLVSSKALSRMSLGLAQKRAPARANVDQRQLVERQRTDPQCLVGTFGAPSPPSRPGGSKIKALRQSDRPLSAREIAEVVESASAARLAHRRLRRLRRLGAIDYTYGEQPRNRINVSYRLVLDLPADDH